MEFASSVSVSVNQNEPDSPVNRFPDDGGLGVYQLLGLKEFMNRMAVDLGVAETDIYPADHFDLIGGVGFGG